jgi:aminopeptidase N
MNRPPLLSSLGFLLILAATTRAGSESTLLECAWSAALLAPAEPASQRQYAPDREVQMVHLALDVTPDFKRRTIEATAVLTFKPVAKPVREVKLDAVDLDVHAVSSTDKLQAWQATDEKVIITFAEPIPADKETRVTLSYSAEPTEGLYFRTPEMGYKDGDTHLFSQGEEISARHWYPCLDSPNQRFTSELACHVPQGMSVISNGRLVSETNDPAAALLVSHWSQDKPHANYLITLVAGYFKKLEDKHGDLPLAFFVPASEIAEAASSFRDTKDMVEFFEQEIGVPYPWAKYYQVCVNDFVAGGMENTSATTLTDGTLFTDATENIRESDGLIAHELAHQWFGDLVTCKDWSHAWLNEGFATYYEALYNGHRHGRDWLLYSLYNRARNITAMANDSTPIVRRTYGEPREMFGYLSYPKAAWVLHMLRSQLGDELYRRCVKTYLQRHQYGNVVTEDLRAVIEELSGRSYDQFFDQWFYHGHFPELEISYEWQELPKLAKVSVRQTQELGSNVLLFNFPLTFRFHATTGATDRVVQISQKEQDFYFPLAAAPERVRMDPDCTLLAKIKFNASAPMLYAQLADSQDVLGRVLAIEQLATRRDQQSVAKLQTALNQDAFFGVRLEAAKALRTIHTDEALAALLASTTQPDARVRLEVVEDIAGFYDGNAFAAAEATVKGEKNPDIRAAALRALGTYSKPELRTTLIGLLGSESYRNELAVAAIGAVRSQDDPSYIGPLSETLSQREAAFTSRGFGQGLDTLAYLARNEDKKDAVLAFLLARVNHKKRSVQLACLNALGTLGDPKAIGPLQTFATAAKASPQRGAAERAIASLRAGRKPVDELQNLRQEVLDLQKANRELRHDLDALKKKLEARTPDAQLPASTAKPKSPRLPQPKAK